MKSSIDQVQRVEFVGDIDDVFRKASRFVSEYFEYDPNFISVNMSYDDTEGYILSLCFSGGAGNYN